MDKKNNPKIYSPLVSVVLLNYNGLEYLKELLEECLDSILKTNYQNFEVIFVDNGSTDKSVDFIKKYFKNARLSSTIKSVKIIENKDNVIAIGYNKGIKVSNGEYIALLSNDMVYDKNWLKEISDVMEKRPEIGIAGCKRLVYGTSNIIEGLGGNLCLDGRPAPIPGHGEPDIGQYENIQDMNWIGGATVVKKEVFNKIGLFDPEYIIFYEDTDICFRARKKGYKVVYIPRAKLWHKVTATIGKAMPKIFADYMGERSRIRFVLIHFSLKRVYSTFLTDWIIWFVTNSYWKKIILRAYWWNIKNIGRTLKKRLEYGPSLPYNYHPVLSHNPSNLIKKLCKMANRLNFIKNNLVSHAKNGE